MTRPFRRNPFQPCGRPGCRLCHPEPLPPREDSLAELLVGAAAIVGLFILLLVVLPAMFPPVVK